MLSMLGQPIVPTMGGAVGHQMGAAAQVGGSMPPPSLPPPSSSFQPLQFKPFKTPETDFDGKRLRKSVMRKTVDYNSSVVAMLEARIWQRDARDRPALQADVCFASEVMPPAMYMDNPINAVVTKFVRTSTNKQKCPIFALAWTPEGRRLVTGASSGEFTLWNGLTFNFETILKAHESSVRAMLWSHNDQWMLTGDTNGVIKYWQTNMNNVKLFQAHKDPIRGVSFAPTDQKFATCSDDGTVRIWDFLHCKEERVLRGHGADVKCVAWHPSRSLLASGSKDNQQPIKLWDPRNGAPLAKLHAHKSTVMDLKWNSNGNWLCSASRDHLLKLFDVRNLSTELQVFRGHKKEAACIAWHPIHEGLFASGGSDGSILYWHVGNEKEVGNIDAAHDGIIWGLAWHPLGHILASGSNDHTTKFWTRNRPGDKMRDKYNLNTLPPGVLADDSLDIDDIPIAAEVATAAAAANAGLIPGMGLEDNSQDTNSDGETIPGLDFDVAHFERFIRKTPYAKPIPRNFQAAWNAAGGLEDEPFDDNGNNWVVTDMGSMFSEPANTEGEKVVTETGEELPAGSVPLEKLMANAIAYYGFYVPLDKVPANIISDAFSFLSEEEAIAEITKDNDFARKLCKEKRQLLNPNAKDEDLSQHRSQEDPFNYHNTQRENQNIRRSGNFNKGNRGGHGEDFNRRSGGNMPPFRGRGSVRGGLPLNNRDDGGYFQNGEDWGWGGGVRGGRGGWRGRGGMNEGGFRREGSAEWGGPRESEWRPPHHDEERHDRSFHEGDGERGGRRHDRRWHENGTSERREHFEEWEGEESYHEQPGFREEYTSRGGRNFGERGGRGVSRGRGGFFRGVSEEDFEGDRGYREFQGERFRQRNRDERFYGSEEERFRGRGGNRGFRGRRGGGGEEFGGGAKRKNEWDQHEEDDRKWKRGGGRPNRGGRHNFEEEFV